MVTGSSRGNNLSPLVGVRLCTFNHYLGPGIVGASYIGLPFLLLTILWSCSKKLLPSTVALLSNFIVKLFYSGWPLDENHGMFILEESLKGKDLLQDSSKSLLSKK